ncbi:MAG TPA: hypothetical protein VKA36_07845 [Solirubrobacterales bacterium]|nr:hypothetical protein [Solirubrobacterales bacterium]
MSGAAFSSGQLKKIAVTSAMALAAINLWTGSPLLALWIGSRVQGSSDVPQMTAVLAVIAALGVQSYLLTKALARLGAIDRRMSGGPGPRYREPPPWLRSARGERSRYQERAASLTTLDRVLVIVFVMAVLAMQVWFFFFAGSPLGEQ